MPTGANMRLRRTVDPKERTVEQPRRDASAPVRSCQRDSAVSAPRSVHDLIVSEVDAVEICEPLRMAQPQFGFDGVA